MPKGTSERGSGVAMPHFAMENDSVSHMDVVTGIFPLLASTVRLTVDTR